MVRNYIRKTEERWAKEDLLEALKSIKEKKIKFNEASRRFGIAKATLYRRYAKFERSGGEWNVTQLKITGGTTLLSRFEEDMMEHKIQELRAKGVPADAKVIRRICYEYCDEKGIPNKFDFKNRMASYDWYYGFLKRHPSIQKVKSTNMYTRKTGTGGVYLSEALLLACAPKTGKYAPKDNRAVREVDDDDDGTPNKNPGNELRTQVLMIPTAPEAGGVIETGSKWIRRSSRKKTPSIKSSQAMVRTRSHMKSNV